MHISAVTRANELVALDEHGVLQWRYQFPTLVNHISCIDLDGDGRQYICAGCWAVNLLTLSPSGALWKLSSWGLNSLPATMFFSAGFTPFTALVSGSGMQAGARPWPWAVFDRRFLDVDGAIIGHSWRMPLAVQYPAGPTGETVRRSVCEVR